MPNIPVSKKHKNFLFIVFIITVGLCVYSNSLDSAFLWDDELLVVDNSYIQTLAKPIVLLTTDIAAGADRESNSYRPLQIFSYALNYSYSKLNVRAYHLTNLFLHITVALLLYCLVQLLIKSKLSAFIATVLFISHPIHTEAVSYISGRADPLVAVFILLTLILYIKYNATGRIYFYVLSMFSFILALLSKEAAIVIPLILLSYDWIYRSKGRIAWVKQLPFLSLGLIYIILRKTVLNFAVPETVIDQYTFLERIPVIFQSLSIYFQKLIVPQNLHMEYKVLIPPINNLAVILGAIITLSLIFLFFVFRKRQKLISFCSAWILINYLPVSGIYPLNAFFAEHWSYIFSIGVFILVGWIAVKLIKQNKITRILTGLFVISLIGININLTLKQNQYWMSAEDFYLRTLQYTPNSARVNFRLGLLYFRQRKLDQAMEATKKAIELDPDFVPAYENLMLGYVAKGKNTEAIGLAQRALKINLNSKVLHNNLGMAYAGEGSYDQAVIEFKRAIFLDPNYAKAYAKLARVYYTQGQYDKAIICYDQAEALGFATSPEFLRELALFR